MYKNQAGQFVDAQLIVRVDGTDGTGLTPTVRIKKDGSAWGASAGVVKEGENGSYEYAPTQAETNCDHLVVKFTEATVLTTLVNLYPIDAALYKADVSNLDAAVSSRMPTTHINATGGKVDAVGTTDVATDVTNPVTTDTASRDASKADVSNLDVAVSTRLADADAIKKGTNHRYTNNGGGPSYDDVTVTDAP